MSKDLYIFPQVRDGFGHMLKGTRETTVCFSGYTAQISRMPMRDWYRRETLATLRQFHEASRAYSRNIGVPVLLVLVNEANYYAIPVGEVTLTDVRYGDLVPLTWKRCAKWDMEYLRRHHPELP